ncbi:hypothetical protein [Erythrobacter alti]|uniref:hypothetical protein n=1 Tax=Erythrobacter alti TaxID=1896145 RepID=UPI0030F4A9F8
MSKQLAISAAASIFAMVALAVFTAPASEFAPMHALNNEGATVVAAAPPVDRIIPALLDLAR